MVRQWEGIHELSTVMLSIAPILSQLLISLSSYGCFRIRTWLSGLLSDFLHGWRSRMSCVASANHRVDDGFEDHPIRHRRSSAPAPRAETQLVGAGPRLCGGAVESNRMKGTWETVGNLRQVCPCCPTQPVCAVVGDCVLPFSLMKLPIMRMQWTSTWM